MAAFQVPDATSRAIQAYIDRLGPKPGVPAALANATPWQQQQAMDLAEAEARESAGGPGYYLPGGVVTESTGDLNMPGHALVGHQNVFHTYAELVRQLASEENRGRKVVVLGAHGGEPGLTTAMHGDVSVDPQGGYQFGPPPKSLDVFTLQRFLGDLPPNYRQAVLASCNPRYVLGNADGAHSARSYSFSLGDIPVTYHSATIDGKDHYGVDWTQLHPEDQTGIAAFTNWHLPTAAAVAPDWIGTTVVSRDRNAGSYPDVPILAGDGTAQGTDQLSDQVQHYTPDQRTRAVDVMQWAFGQIPRYIAEDQLANYNATLGAPELQPPARAHGGPVQAGEPYQVGEQGPELFLPADPSAAHPVFTYLQALSPLRGG